MNSIYQEPKEENKDNHFRELEPNLSNQPKNLEPAKPGKSILKVGGIGLGVLFFLGFALVSTKGLEFLTSIILSIRLNTIFFAFMYLIGFLAPILVIGAIVGLIIFVTNLTSKDKKKAIVPGGGDTPENFHGSARFAVEEDLLKFKVRNLEPGSFFLSMTNNGAIALPRHIAVQHGIVLGGSGTGKSRGYFLPNCAWVPGTSFIVTDPKSELWELTSGFHANARRYAPTEPNSSECFNWVPLCGDARMAELCARAIIESGNTANTDQFWIDSETAYLAALFAHASTLICPTPLTVYRLFTRQSPEVLLNQLLNSPSEVAQEQANIFNQTDPKIKGSIVPAVAAKLQFLRDPDIARFTSASTKAPNFGKLRVEPTAIYFCMREHDLTRLRPLTSLFFSVLLEQVAGVQISEGHQGTPITLILDEFANIGTIPDFQTTISLARGRGVAIWLGIQSLSQLEARYGKPNAQTIISNTATKIALHGLDLESAEYISKMLGDKTVVVNRVSKAYGSRSGQPLAARLILMGSPLSSTHNRTEHKRPLMSPDEVMRLPDNEAIIRSGNRYPMRLFKIYYNEPARTSEASGLGAAKSLEFEPMQKQRQHQSQNHNFDRGLPPPLPPPLPPRGEKSAPPPPLPPVLPAPGAALAGDRMISNNGNGKRNGSRVQEIPEISKIPEKIEINAKIELIKLEGLPATSKKKSLKKPI